MRKQNNQFIIFYPAINWGKLFIVRFSVEGMIDYNYDII